MEISMKDMIEKYLESRKIKGFSPLTLKTDRTGLNKFAAYLATAKLKFSRTTCKTIKPFYSRGTSLQSESANI
jgi:site-specific recombinase XerD